MGLLHPGRLVTHRPSEVDLQGVILVAVVARLVLLLLLLLVVLQDQRHGETIVHVAQSERQGYDSNLDPGLAKLHAVVNTPGRSTNRSGSDDDDLARLQSIVNSSQRSSASASASTISDDASSLGKAALGCNDTRSGN